MLGGGPTANGRDAFHEFLAILDEEQISIPKLGDPRTRRESGWRELFAGWHVAPFERWEIELGGTFDEIWQFASTSYELATADADVIRDKLHARVGDRAACRAAMFLARAVRAG